MSSHQQADGIPMPPRPSRRSQRSVVRQRQFQQDLAGVGLVALGLLLFVSLLAGPRGLIPRALVPTLLYLFGLGAYVIPAACLGIGFTFVITRHVLAVRRLSVGAPLLFLVLLAFCHLQIEPGREFDLQVLSSGGGILGGSLTWISRQAVGQFGSYLVLFVLALIALMILTGATARDLLLTIGRGLRVAVRWLFADRRAQVIARRRSRRPASSGNPAPAPGGTPPPPGLPPAGPSAPPVPRPPASDRRGRRSSGHSSGQTSGETAQLALLTPPRPWRHPSLDLLAPPEANANEEAQQQEAEENIVLVEDTLASFGINARVVRYERGPAVTRYEVEPERGIRVNRVANLADDLALALAALDVRVEAPIPGKAAIGIEVPNRDVAIVPLRSILETQVMRRHPSKLAFAVGKDIAGEVVIGDLARMPHLLIGGATNAGKSVCLNCIIASILYRARPDEVKFIMVDPKRVELSSYDGIPHLMAPVVQTAPQAADVLRQAIAEMDHRYDLFAIEGVRNISEYNQRISERLTEGDVVELGEDGEPLRPLPYVVIVIDELADLMMQARHAFEQSICRIAQLARATGIHLVVATQRPSVDVVTGLIKANISSRIALAVASQHDSRVILDHVGAERLIGRGDMLYNPIDASKSRRIQGAYIDGTEVERLVEFLRSQGEPEYDIIPEVSEDDGDILADDQEPSDSLYAAAVEYVVAAQEASVSMMQRRFRIGYARAGRLIDMMERRGVVGPSEGSKARTVLVGPDFVASSAHASGAAANLPDDEDREASGADVSLHTAVVENEPVDVGREDDT